MDPSVHLCVCPSIHPSIHPWIHPLLCGLVFVVVQLTRLCILLGTLVRRDLVPESKRLDGSVAIRCAHGDTVEYPLATVDISIGDQKFTVEAGVADALPASVLLGTGVPLEQPVSSSTSSTACPSTAPAR